MFNKVVHCDICDSNDIVEKKDSLICNSCGSICDEITNYRWLKKKDYKKLEKELEKKKKKQRLSKEDY